MYGHQYDQSRAAKMQDATEEMIRMRQPRSTGPHPDPRDERFAEIQRAQRIIDGLRNYRESLLTCPLTMEPAGRQRIRELSNPPRDDHDRAVLALCDDIERLIKAIAAPLP